MKSLHDLLRQHGTHSLAYSVAQPDLSYFGDDTAGIIAYRKSLGQCTVLGDPICAPSQKMKLLEKFLGIFPHALFMQIQDDTANALRKRGLQVTPVGVENQIDTNTFHLRGKRKADLRHYRNKAEQAAITVTEQQDTRQLRAQLQPISKAWLASKSRFARELAFLARPYVSTPEPGVRIFVAEHNATPIGFTLLDPMHHAGHCIGYALTILRSLLTAPEGTLDYINLHIIKTLRAEGIPTFNLGVSPFQKIDDIAEREGKGSYPTYWTYKALETWGNPIYHFRGLAFHKRRYRAQEIPVYSATNSRIGLWPLLASSHACHML